MDRVRVHRQDVWDLEAVETHQDPTGSPIGLEPGLSSNLLISFRTKRLGFKSNAVDIANPEDTVMNDNVFDDNLFEDDRLNDDLLDDSLMDEVSLTKDSSAVTAYAFATGAQVDPPPDSRLTSEDIEKMRKDFTTALDNIAKIADRSSCLTTALAAENALALYRRTPWNQPLNNFWVDMSFSSLQLIFCKKGEEWMNDDLMECIGHALCRASGQKRESFPEDSPARPRRVFIVPVVAMQYLVEPLGEKLNSDQALDLLKGWTWFTVLKDHLHRYPDSVVYFPFSVKRQHWTMARFDVKNRKWSIADSLSDAPIVRVYYQGLQRFSECLGLPCANAGGAVPNCNVDFKAGRQVDGHSCGYFALNAMESDLFGIPLASAGTSEFVRLRALLLLYEESTQDHGPIKNGRLQPRRYQDTGDQVLPLLNQFPSCAWANLEDRLPFPRAAIPDGTSPPFGAAGGSQGSYFSDTSSDSSTEGDSSEDDLTDKEWTKLDYSDAAIEARYDARTKKAKADEYYGMECESTSESGSQGTKTLSSQDSTSSTKRMSKLSRRTLDAQKVKDNPDLWQRFCGRVRKVDPNARFDPVHQPRHVWCSLCLDWIPLKEVFQVSDFTKHYETCLDTRQKKGLRPGKVGDIQSFFKPLPKSPPTQSNLQVPGECTCPGLNSAFDPRVVRYLERTGAMGGGAPPIKFLKQKLRLQRASQPTFQGRRRARQKGGLFSKDDEAKELRKLEERYFKWINHKTLELVRAKGCTHTTEFDGLPCQPCRQLRSNKVFLNALARPAPDDDNVKYTPHNYVHGFLRDLVLKYHGLDKLIDKKGKKSYMLRLAEIITKDSEGENRFEVFAGMCESIERTEDRRRRGKGTQGLVRNQAFEETMHSLAMMCPMAYRKLRKVFGGPHPRTFQLKRQKAPAFHLGIDSRNFDTAARIFGTEGDDTPLSLSVDDTMCAPKLRTVWDPETKLWSMVGHINPETQTALGSELVFDQDKDLQAALKRQKLTRGKKVRAFLLSSNTIGVPSVLVGALVIGDSANAERLFPVTVQVLEQLGRVGLLKRLVSIVSDGCPIETKIHDMLLERYSKTTSVIHSPNEAFQDVVTSYAIIGGTPVVFLRSTPSIPRRTPSTLKLVAVIEQPGSPLYKRDVVKRDRQDDQAMERYLSAEMVEHVTKHNPERLGFAVYLYVFGELHSAVQSRSLPHTTRTHMLLTVEYFLQGWETFTQRHPDYSAAQFIPPKFYKIVKRLIRAVLGLIRIFRDYRPDRSEPLLPWRHMTETLEHFFGTVRTHVQEFDIVEFSQIARKALTLMDFELKSAMSNRVEAEDARTRAGYQHTYHLTGDLSLHALNIFPTDAGMSQIALSASIDALDLLGALGMRIEWDLGPEAFLTPNCDEDDNDGFEDFMKGYLNDLNPEFNTALEAMIEDVQTGDASEQMQEVAAEVALAVATLEVETQADIDALPEQTDEALITSAAAAHREFRQEIGMASDRASVPSSHRETQSLVLPDDQDRTDAFYRPALNLAELVARRYAHQTDYSRTAKKRGGGGSQSKKNGTVTQMTNDSSASIHAARKALHSRLIKAAEEEENLLNVKKSGSARERRYRGKDSNGRWETAKEVERRVVVETSRVNAAQDKRNKRYKKFTRQVDYRNAVGTAQVSEESPLQPLDLVVFVAGPKQASNARHCRVSLGIVMVMYEIAGSSNHANVPSAESVAKLSYVVVQELKQFTGSRFTPIIHTAATPSYFHVNSRRIIQKVGNVSEFPATSPSAMVTVSRGACDALRNWQRDRLIVATAMKAEAKKQTGEGEGEDGDKDEEDEEEEEED